jgi:hypothetical protein
MMIADWRRTTKVGDCYRQTEVSQDHARTCERYKAPSAISVRGVSAGIGVISPMRRSGGRVKARAPQGHEKIHSMSSRR